MNNMDLSTLKPFAEFVKNASDKEVCKILCSSEKYKQKIFNALMDSANYWVDTYLGYIKESTNISGDYDNIHIEIIEYDVFYDNMKSLLKDMNFSEEVTEAFDKCDPINFDDFNIELWEKALNNLKNTFINALLNETKCAYNTMYDIERGDYTEFCDSGNFDCFLANNDLSFLYLDNDNNLYELLKVGMVIPKAKKIQVLN